MTISELLGELPADLAARALPKASAPFIDFAKLSPKHNTFDAAIAKAGHAALHVPVLQLLVGAVHVADVAGEDDKICATAGEVIRWSPEDGLFVGQLAFDVASFDRAWEVFRARKKLTKAQLAERLAGVRFVNQWPMSELPGGERPGVSAYEPRQDRGAWIARVLAAGDLAPDYWPLDQRKLKPPKGYDRSLPDAMYWLLRSLLLDEPRVKEIAATLAKSPMRIVADAARSVQAVLGGRATLGPITDIATTRAILADAIANPADATTRHESRVSARAVVAKLPAPLTLVPCDRPKATEPTKLDGNYAETWNLPGGTKLEVSYRGIFHASKDKRLKRVDTPAAESRIEYASPHAGGKRFLTNHSGALYEIALPSGATDLRWWGGGGGGPACYAAGDRILVNTGDMLVLHERRGPLAVPGSSLAMPGRELAVVADGKVAIVSGDDASTTIVGIYDDVLVELARLAMFVDDVRLAGDRVLLAAGASTWELGHVAAAHAAHRPKWQQPALKSAKAIAAPKPPKPFAFTAKAGKETCTVTWGKGRSVTVQGEVNVMRMTVSPSGKRALVWAWLWSTVTAVDLATGDQLGRWEDDFASGMMKAVTWLDDDHFAFAHWQTRICRIGVDEPVYTIEVDAISIAGVRTGKAATMIAAIVCADIGDPQRLEIVDVTRLDGAVRGKTRKAQLIPQKLATVGRFGDAVVLAVGGSHYKLS